MPTFILRRSAPRHYHEQVAALNEQVDACRQQIAACYQQIADAQWQMVVIRHKIDMEDK